MNVIQANKHKRNQTNKSNRKVLWRWADSGAGQKECKFDLVNCFKWCQSRTWCWFELDLVKVMADLNSKILEWWWRSLPWSWCLVPWWGWWWEQRETDAKLIEFDSQMRETYFTLLINSITKSIWYLPDRPLWHKLSGLAGFPQLRGSQHQGWAMSMKLGVENVLVLCYYKVKVYCVLYWFDSFAFSFEIWLAEEGNSTITNKYSYADSRLFVEQA